MVNKVAESFIQRVFTQSFPLSKTTKIALSVIGALSFFAAVYYFKSSLAGRVSTPPITPSQTKTDLNKKNPLEMGFSSDLVITTFGEENFKNLPVVFMPNKKREDVVLAAKKFEAISKMCNDFEGDPFYDISLGMDEWGCPFMRITFAERANTKKCYDAYIYSNMESQKQQWYLNKDQIVLIPDDIAKLISGTHQTNVLADSVNNLFKKALP